MSNYVTGGAGRQRSPCPESASELALTGREVQVLRLLVDGQTNKQIAREIGIAAKTVEFHVSKLLRKHGVDSRFELMDTLKLLDQRVKIGPHAGVVARALNPEPTGDPVAADAPTSKDSRPVRSRLGSAVQVMFRPSLGFRHLAANPDLTAPAVLLGGAGAFFGLVAAWEMFPAATPMSTALISVFGGIIACMTWFMVAGLVYVIGFSVPERATSAGVFSVMGYALLPEALQTVILGVGVLIGGDQAANPGALVGAPDSWPRWTEAFFSTFNMFSLWTAVLMFFAVGAVLGLQARRAIAACGFLALLAFGLQWGVFTLIPLG